MLTLSLQLIKQVDTQLVEELKDVENMYWPLSDVCCWWICYIAAVDGGTAARLRNGFVE